MASRISHESKALIVRRDGENGGFDIWQHASSANLGVEHSLPTLREKPSWTDGNEQASVGSDTIAIRRLGLPPSVHFSRGAQLRAASLYAAVLASGDDPSGDWISADKFVAQAEQQWQEVVGGVLNHLRHAVETGFLAVPRSQRPLQATAQPSSLSQSRPEPSADSGQTVGGSIGPGCSGYEEATHAWGLEEGEEESGAQRDEGGHSPRQSSEEAELQEAGEAGGDREAPQWRPGEVAVVTEGGRDVQSVLDGDGLRLGVIHWHASWIEACLELEPFLSRLAGRFLGVAIMKLDVEASMASKLLAYEKVLTRGESRRRGAKPVVKNGQSFPCFTIHQPCNLVPSQTFTGRDALDQLAMALAAHGPELTKAPVLKASEQSAVPTPPASTSAQTLSRSEAAAPSTCAAGGSLPSAQPAAGSRQPDNSQHASGSSLAGRGAEGKAGSPPNVKVMKRGASEFKHVLTQAKATNGKVAVLWISGSAGAQQSLDRLGEGHPGDFFFHGDVTLHRDNRQLATSLRVKNYPTIQVFVNMKLVKHIDNKAVVADAFKAISKAFAALDAELKARQQEGPGDSPPASLPASSTPASSTPARPAPASDPPTSSTSASSVPRDASSEAPTTPAAAEADPARQEGGEGGNAASSPRERDTAFDPPDKIPPKGEAKRRFPSGTGIYWPKMPCLQCGCPWWLGEDWDARCARCKWTAQEDGYDDDSQPLPKFKAKYKHFTSLIKQGQTADWPA